MKTIRVGVLMGGRSEEAYLSLRSAEQIFKHADPERYQLIGLKWEPDGSWTEYAPGSMDQPRKRHPHMLALFGEFRADILFVALHNPLDGGDGRLPGLLDLADIPYTGNGFFPCVTGMDKFLNKLLFQQLGIQVPRFIHVTPQTFFQLDAQARSIKEAIGYPCMVKPSLSGSSLGIAKIGDYPDLKACLAERLEQYDSILVEEYIQGRELSVGILGGSGPPRVLPVAEIRYPGAFFDADCKYKDDYTVIAPAPELPGPIADELGRMGLDLHQAMKFAGISRTDFILTPQNTIHALEINTHPGLGGHSIYPAMLRAAGIPMAELIDRLIAGGLARAGS